MLSSGSFDVACAKVMFRGPVCSMFLVSPVIFELRTLRTSLRGAYSLHACLDQIKLLITFGHVDMDDSFDVISPP